MADGKKARARKHVYADGPNVYTITVDLTGSNPEVPTGYNVPFEGTLLVAAYFALFR